MGTEKENGTPPCPLLVQEGEAGPAMPESLCDRPRIPVATYRLQFNRDFRFDDARDLVSYLHRLGISDLYASPCFKARPGSLHGYDILDPNCLNPELGSEADYAALAAELQRHGLGQLLDVVPNHMCIESRENLWWMDLLENGPSARHAGFFDIDWEPVKKELKDKVLSPSLATSTGRYWRTAN